ncbi:MAG: chemotaxis protein CheW [Thermodesulfobacteriota bacterium]|nr:chemotaxis protein CheW [Thermodesulfobacteriota bacterium]
METDHEILCRRAALLAKPVERISREETIHVVEFSLADETYAFELGYVKKVVPLQHIVALPGAPNFVLGITDYVGQIVSVLDLRVFFDLPIVTVDLRHKIIVLQAQQMQVAVLAEDILGVTDLVVSQLQDNLPTLTGVRSRYLQGVTPDQTIVLDVVSLLSDDSLIVH